MSPRLNVRHEEDGPQAPQAEATTIEDGPPPTANVERERVEGRIAGIAGSLSVLLTLAAVPVGASDVPNRAGGESNDRTLLLDVGQSANGQLTAMWLRVASLLLIAAVAVFLFRAIRARQPAHARFIPALGVIAVVVVAAATAVGFFEVRDVARDYIASGPRTLDRAESLLDDARDGGLLRAANIGQILGGLLLGVWISLTSLEGMRVGLLTRFLGVFGIGTGLASAVGIPISAALFMGWFGSVAILAFGYWPGGRPPAWETGRAIGWDEVEAQQGGARRARREGAL